MSQTSGVKIQVVPFGRKLVSAIGPDNKPLDPAQLGPLQQHVQTANHLSVTMQSVFTEFCRRFTYNTSGSPFNVVSARGDLARLTSQVMQVPPDAAMSTDLTTMDRDKYVELRKALDSISNTPNVTILDVFTDLLMTPRDIFL